MPLIVIGIATACAWLKPLFGSTSLPLGGGGVPPAASTAALALTMPVPHWLQMPGKGRVEPFSAVAT